MKRKMSLRAEMLALFVLPGALLLICSLFGMFLRTHATEVIVTVAGVCMLVFWTLALVMLFRGKSEPDDEMAIENQHTARMYSWIVTVIELSGLEIYTILSGRALLLTSDIIALLLSSMFLVYGVLFLVLDKWGKT